MDHHVNNEATALLERIVAMEEKQADTQAMLAAILANQMRESSVLSSHFKDEAEKKNYPFMAEVVRLSAFASTQKNDFRRDGEKAWDKLREEFISQAKAGYLTPEIMTQFAYLVDDEEARFGRAAALLRLPPSDHHKEHNVRVCERMNDDLAFLKANGVGIMSCTFPFFPAWANLSPLNARMLLDASNAAIAGGAPPPNFTPSVFRDASARLPSQGPGIAGGAAALSLPVPVSEAQRLAKELADLRGQVDSLKKKNQPKNNNQKGGFRGGEPPAYQNHLSLSATPFVPPQSQQPSAPSSSYLPPTAPRPAPPRADF